MNKEEKIRILLRLAKENGIVFALYFAFGSTVNVAVPLSKAALETGIDELDFSVRGSNAMKRSGVFTVLEVTELISSGGLMRIRNLGKKTQNEIKTRILTLGYDHLSDRERVQFWYDTLERNKG